MNEQIRESRIRLVLLDDLALFRTSLSEFLAAQPGFEVAGECSVSSEALDILRICEVDVVLLDLHFGGEGAERFISAAHSNGYRGRFLIVTGAADARESATAIKLGASGIFLKSDASESLLQAIRLVAAGALWVDQKVIRVMADRLFDLPAQPDDQSGYYLTEREQIVLSGILEGLTNRKIGDKIGLSESTVKAAVQQLFLRAGVRTRSQLVRAALEGSLGNNPAANLMIGSPAIGSNAKLCPSVKL